MLTVCTSATSTGGLTTTAKLRSLLGTSSTYDDAFQSQLVRAATDWAENVVGYPLRGPEVYQETLPGYNRPYLVTGRAPIRAIFRLYDSTDTGTATEILSSQYRIEDANAGFIGRDAGFRWTAGIDWNLTEAVLPYWERRPWLIEYSAGYIGEAGKESTFDGTTSTNRTLPEDIELAVLMRAQDWHEGQSEVRRKEVGDLMIEYQANPQTGAPTDKATRLLRPYRRAK